jgi:Holliday junction resolvase RusA-like endonuclease
MSLHPVYFPQDKSIHLVIPGKPWVQKNNLHIFYKNPRTKTGPFIDHSKEMKVARDRSTKIMYDQYRAQGYRKPIDYLISVDLVFYVLRRSEPDLDNLPAFILDAMMGVRVKGMRGVKVGGILVDDKLVREERSQKILEGDVGYAGEPRTEVTIRRYAGR